MSGTHKEKCPLPFLRWYFSVLKSQNYFFKLKMAWVNGGSDHAKVNKFQQNTVDQNMGEMIFDDFFLQLLHFEIFDFLCWLFRRSVWWRLAILFCQAKIKTNVPQIET